MNKSVRLAFLSALVLAVLAFSAFTVLAASGYNLAGLRADLASTVHGLESPAERAAKSDYYLPQDSGRSDHLPGCDEAESEYDTDDG